jgi:hypothetical protein
MADSFQPGPPRWPSEPPSGYDRFAHIDFRKPGSNRSGWLWIIALVAGAGLALVALGTLTWRSASRPSAVVTALMPATMALAAPPGARPAELIVGRWAPLDDQKATIQFLNGGEIRVTFEGNSITGTYKFLENDLMEVELVIPGSDKKATQKLKIKVDKDTLETTDESKKVDKFKRVK